MLSVLFAWRIAGDPETESTSAAQIAKYGLVFTISEASVLG